MKIKTKLNAGVGLLFLMILVLSVLSGWYINQLKKDTNNILEANYNTLQYSRNMLLALEEISSDPLAYGVFEKHLEKQQKNVTEPGEKEATDNVAVHFQALKKDSGNVALQSSIRKDIAELMQLNMSAIEHKSSIADSTAKSAIMAISVTGMLCFLIAFILLVNLPSNIADPIQILTGSIKQIANQNYRERVHFESKSEFGDLAMSFNIMAEKLQEYSESKLDKIIRGKRRIETLIDNMHNPVIGIDENKKVLFVNNEALKITGLKKENFVGKLIQDVAVMNDLVRNIIKEIIEGNTKNASETMKIYADGKESYFEKEIIDINVTPTGEQQSQFIGQVIMLRNITPFKELDLAKTNFLGTVSHEFKTPISSIQMGLQLLENDQIGSLNDEQKNLVNGIKEDSDRLLKITGELLNITQVESGSMQLNIQSSDIRTIIDYAMNANRSAAEQKQILFNINIENGLKEVLADTEKTSWVLNNLISNAVRYSYENSQITVDVKKVGEQVQFSVTDAGQGIPPQYISKVFDRYFKIPGTKKEGTGLGLTISKQFIEAQGGKISVESEIGVGSQFSFTLHER
ncbi:ATP-binding protein [Epilithonimonas ginsengisoli]|uniref:histidine kinase n=1 Tax=Epilithonimonas ginsengisoli TaxID=1245592 RepID=A0ABU4JH35_9FLAO|nr:MULTISPECIES: ATP-binding protein [Chryseobacterium group]MBV6878734.1 PAS domain-containing protein [Epilithonimonas sp. FP105]MDW8548934.1 ATP-binding protein [Epilithonimonas ginsengisoli]OAH75618.1 PAS domain-containing sensor histidine kinase [Chryseobacterium sp. FP211-J200]